MSAGPAHRRTSAARGAGPAQARWIYVALVLLLIVMVGLGFGPYYRALAIGRAQAHWLIHVHAAIYSGWMLLLLVQVLLLRRGRTNTHRRLGRFGIAYGGLVLLLGLVVAVAAPALSVLSGRDTLDEAAAFMLLPLGDMLLFGGFLFAAIAYRRKPELHKRLMLLAAIALVFPAVARFAHDAGLLSVLLVWLLPLALAMAHDYVTQRRVAPVYLGGLAVLVIGFARIALMESDAWIGFGRRILLHVLPAGYSP